MSGDNVTILCAIGVLVGAHILEENLLLRVTCCPFSIQSIRSNDNHMLIIVHYLQYCTGGGKGGRGRRSEVRGRHGPSRFWKKKTLLLFAISMTNKFLYIGPFWENSLAMPLRTDTPRELIKSYFKNINSKDSVYYISVKEQMYKGLLNIY